MTTPAEQASVLVVSGAAPLSRSSAGAWFGPQYLNTFFIYALRPFIRVVRQGLREYCHNRSNLVIGGALLASILVAPVAQLVAELAASGPSPEEIARAQARTLVAMYSGAVARELQNAPSVLVVVLHSEMLLLPLVAALAGARHFSGEFRGMTFRQCCYRTGPRVAALGNVVAMVCLIAGLAAVPYLLVGAAAALLALDGARSLAAPTWAIRLWIVSILGALPALGWAAALSAFTRQRFTVLVLTLSVLFVTGGLARLVKGRAYEGYAQVLPQAAEHFMLLGGWGNGLRGALGLVAWSAVGALLATEWLARRDT